MLLTIILVIIRILWHVFMIYVGYVLIETTRENWFSQGFWGLMGAIAIFTNAFLLLEMLFPALYLF